MDILVRDIYSKLKTNLGVENIVVAGGCVRDFVLGGKFTDVDIYIPSSEIKHGLSMSKEFVSIGDPIPFNVYEDMVNNVSMKYDLKWKDIDIDLMVVDTRNFDSDEESFGSFVTKGFDFGLNMIYYDGFTIVESEEFSRDKDHNRLTLQKLESLDHLNHYLERANKIQKKYPNFQLDLNKVLQLRSDKKSKNVGNVGFHEPPLVPPGINPAWRDRLPVVLGRRRADRLRQQFVDNQLDEIHHLR